MSGLERLWISHDVLYRQSSVLDGGSRLLRQFLWSQQMVPLPTLRKTTHHADAGRGRGQNAVTREACHYPPQWGKASWRNRVHFLNDLIHRARKVRENRNAARHANFFATHRKPMSSKARCLGENV